MNKTDHHWSALRLGLGLLWFIFLNPAHAAEIPQSPLTTGASASAAAKLESGDRPVEGIMDNSFLVEEAYNQEAGVVQHIFNGFFSVDKFGGPDDRRLDSAFTQEWPVFSQRHQFSYTIPYNFVETGGQSDNGLGDILLNYRFQACFNSESLTAFAPRISLILPTGSFNQGLSDDTFGYQLNLPFSTALKDRWFLHANAGLTFLPDAAPEPRRDLLHYTVGASAIYAAARDLHFMLEWVGGWFETPTPLGATQRDFSCLISPGVRRAFNLKNDAQLVLGLAAPIGLTGSAPDYGVFLYVSFEHSFLKPR